MIQKIRTDSQAQAAILSLELTEKGLELLDDSGNCPLCDTSWPPGELREYLENRLFNANVARKQQEHIKELCKGIDGFLNPIKASLQKVIAATQTVDLEGELSILKEWFSNVEKLSSALSAPIDQYTKTDFDPVQVQQMLAPASIAEILCKI